MCALLCRVCPPLQALQPSEGETSAISNHVIIAGFGRVGQMIAQLLSKKMIPFVALDVRTDRVQVCGPAQHAQHVQRAQHGTA